MAERRYLIGMALIFAAALAAAPGARGSMKAMDASLSATRNAADLLGASDRVGSIQAGRFADIIAVAGDPLADISEMTRVRFVMKGGAVHRGPAGVGAR